MNSPHFVLSVGIKIVFGFRRVLTCFTTGHQYNMLDLFTSFSMRLSPNRKGRPGDR